MRMTIPTRTFACALFALSGSAAFAADAGTTLACNPDTAERTFMKQAPGKIQRANKRLLVVTTARGPQRFADQPPFDEALGGVRWHYCGYDPKARVHLIGKDDETVFTGVLLQDDTGKQLPAGHTVVLSPDRKAFVAVVQPDGLDGEEWTVHDSSGAVIWTGYAGVLTKDAGHIVSQFTAPHWSTRGELTTEFVCAGSTRPKDGTAALLRSSSGKWTWEVRGSCPKT